MEWSFLSEYFEFAKKIDKCNKITAVISTDYNSKNTSKQLTAFDKYRNSVDDLLAFIQNLSGISRPQTKDLNKLIKAIKRNANSIKKSKVQYQAVFNHYSSLAEAREISFIVVFQFGETWNVNFTSSLRLDRIETHANRFMQAKASKNYLIICSYPYQDNKSIKCIDDLKKNPSFCGISINVVCLEEFMDDLLYNIFKYYKDKKTGSYVLASPKNMLSIVNNERGVQIEEMYASILSNKVNYDLYQNNVKEEKREQTEGSFLPNHFSIIVDKLFSDLSITAAQVSDITATRVGASLNKADISVDITLQNGTVIKKGISLKSSSTDEVSVHEKHAIDFINVLGISDPDVKDALIQFEKKKSFSKMDKKLYSALADYFLDTKHQDELLEWAIVGETNNPLKADYIMLHSYVHNSEKAISHGIRIFSSEEYIRKIKTSDRDGSFRTHLTFTYKGNIQLKAPFFFEQN